MRSSSMSSHSQLPSVTVLLWVKCIGVGKVTPVNWTVLFRPGSSMLVRCHWIWPHSLRFVSSVLSPFPPLERITAQLTQAVDSVLSTTFPFLAHIMEHDLRVKVDVQTQWIQKVLHLASATKKEVSMHSRNPEQAWAGLPNFVFEWKLLVFLYVSGCIPSTSAWL